MSGACSQKLSRSRISYTTAESTKSNCRLTCSVQVCILVKLTTEKQKKLTLLGSRLLGKVPKVSILFKCFKDEGIQLPESLLTPSN